MTKNCLYCGNPIVSKRSTKKYCSENCKQLAFYKRTQLQLSPPFASDYAVDGRNNLAPFGNDDTTDDDFSIKEKALNVKQTVNDNISFEQWDESDRNEQIDTTHLPNNMPSNQPVNVKSFTVNPHMTYQPVESSFIAKIVEYTDNSSDMLMFQNPQKYWGLYDLHKVKWVSLRLRCLLENLLKLSNLPTIDYATLTTVKDAFTDLISSGNFKRLPSNYPHTEFIKELEQSLAFIVKQYKRCNDIRFRLTPKRKVEIIAKRFMMADFVPAAKFYDLDFKKITFTSLYSLFHNSKN
jgi:hypothetical protein